MPFLVSRICQHIDNSLDKDWSADGVKEAVKILLSEANTLFDDVFNNLENNEELHDFIYGLLIVGETGNFVDRVAISNKIFETRISNYFISKDLRRRKQSDGILQRDVVRDGRFDMELCLRKFAEHYAEIYNAKDKTFLERHGRLLFLSYLRPLINGQGFYHIESQFTDLRRMDIVVDFGIQQFIIELKLWRGEAYQSEGYEQLCGYLESKRTDTGFMITFDFREEANKGRKAEWIEVDGKRIFDVMV